jgi:hypothetical protein
VAPLPQLDRVEREDRLLDEIQRHVGDIAGPLLSSPRPDEYGSHDSAPHSCKVWSGRVRCLRTGRGRSFRRKALTGWTLVGLSAPLRA